MRACWYHWVAQWPTLSEANHEWGHWLPRQGTRVERIKMRGCLCFLQAIRNSGQVVSDLAQADFVYVDMHCYHTWWLSWHHPLGNQNLTDPTRYIQRTYEMLQDMPR